MTKIYNFNIAYFKNLNKYNLKEKISNLVNLIWSRKKSLI